MARSSAATTSRSLAVKDPPGAQSLRKDQGGWLAREIAPGQEGKPATDGDTRRVSNSRQGGRGCQADLPPCPAPLPRPAAQAPAFQELCSSWATAGNAADCLPSWKTCQRRHPDARGVRNTRTAVGAAGAAAPAGAGRCSCTPAAAMPFIEY